MRKNELPKEVNDYMDEYIKTHTNRTAKSVKVFKELALQC